ncbi:DoxX family protein [Leifsonia poae]|uniref:DoxX family protein n=1 Tax=Leifsonia poae TaxID=110933 RepID=UPI001CBD6A0A|nr:DoxX family protein [Leifsonia poae]
MFLLLTILCIVANGATAIATFARAKFVVANLGDVDLDPARIPLLAALQAAGAVGLLLGLLGVPFIGVAAAGGLVVFFIGAVVVHLRSGAFRSLPSPVLFLALAIATFVVTVLR